MKKYFIVFYLVFSVSSRAAPSTFKIFSIRPPVTILRNELKTVDPSRGMSLELGDKFMVGARGGVTFDSPKGSTLSVIGPAMLTLLKVSAGSYLLRAEYGDFFFKKAEEDFYYFESAYFRTSEIDEEAELYFESPISSQFFRVRNLKGKFSIGSTAVKVNQMISQSAESRFESVLREEDLKQCRDRHFNNRQNQDLSISGEMPYDPSKVDPLAGFFEIMPFGGTTRFATPHGNIAQYTGFIGGSLKVGTHLYPNLPNEPQRKDFLYSLILRMGIDLSLFSGNYHFSSEAFTRSHFISGGVFAGIGFHALSVDAFYGIPKTLNFSGTNDFKIASVYGLDVQYRIDIKELANAEVGLILGLRILDVPITSMGSSLMQDAGLSADKINTINFAPLVALSMRF